MDQLVEKTKTKQNYFWAHLASSGEKKLSTKLKKILNKKLSFLRRIRTRSQQTLRKNGKNIEQKTHISEKNERILQAVSPSIQGYCCQNTTSSNVAPERKGFDSFE